MRLFVYCLFVCLLVCLVGRFAYLFVGLLVCWFGSLFLCFLVCLFLCVSVSLYVCLCFGVCLSEVETITETSFQANHLYICNAQPVTLILEYGKLTHIPRINFYVRVSTALVLHTIVRKHTRA